MLPPSLASQTRPGSVVPVSQMMVVFSEDFPFGTLTGLSGCASSFAIASSYLPRRDEYCRRVDQTASGNLLVSMPYGSPARGGLLPEALPVFLPAGLVCDAW